ncbi:MAG: sensor histidine kinase [Rickettsiales bacterium]
MRLFQNISIRQKLTYIIMAVSTVSVLLTTLAISIIGVYNLRNNIISELNVSASIVGDRNTSALEFDNYDQVESNLSVFSVKQPIVQACLYDKAELSLDSAKDVLVGQYFAMEYGAQTCPEPPESQQVEVTNSRIKISKAVTNFAGEIIGYIYIESTLVQIHDYIQKQTFIALLVGLMALVISYLLAIGLQNAISRPILRLADTAKQVTTLKDYSIRAEQAGDPHKEFNNELVHLTTAFNEMLTEIGTRDQQLKKQNIDLEKAKDLAESANRAKSQFLANISHELRTPLNAIIGFSSILMNQLFGPLGDNKYLEYSKDINESGTHLLDIINDILDLSKAEAGKLDINYEEVNIGKSINKCLTILAERAEKGRVTISVDAPKTLPALVADRLRFIQILLNIMSNAVKFTEPDGKVHIAAKTLEADGEITDFVVTIQDTGIGMSKEDLDKAFQSFGQVDSGLNRKYEGTGLGLPLTRKLVELHYGKIEMESEMGKGTLVRVTIPAVPPPEAGYVPLD